MYSLSLLKHLHCCHHISFQQYFTGSRGMTITAALHHISLYTSLYTGQCRFRGTIVKRGTLYCCTNLVGPLPQVKPLSMLECALLIALCALY